jgi:hypothetical protein
VDLSGDRREAGEELAEPRGVGSATLVALTVR